MVAAVANAGRTRASHADWTDAYHDPARGQMPVVIQPLLAFHRDRRHRGVEF